MLLLALLLLSSLHTVIAQSRIISPETPLVSFHWIENTTNGSRKLLPACTPIRIQLSSRTESPEIFPPFILSVFPERARPVTKLIENVGVNGSFWTTLDLLPDVNFSMAIRDSKNHFGGLVGGYTTVASTSVICNQTITPPSELSYSVDFDMPNVLAFSILGGSPPFVVSILNPAGGTLANATCRSRNLRVAQQVPRGQAYSVFVSDSNNLSSLVSRQFISTLSTVPPPSRKSSIGYIIGATIGVISLITISLILLLLLRNKRRLARSEEIKRISSVLSLSIRTGKEEGEKRASSPFSSSASQSGSGHFFTTPSPTIPQPVIIAPSPSLASRKRTQHRPAHIIIPSPQRPSLKPTLSSPTSSYNLSPHRSSFTRPHDCGSPSGSGGGAGGGGGGGGTSCSTPGSPTRSQRRSSLGTLDITTSRRGSVATMGEEEPLADPSEFRFRL